MFSRMRVMSVDELRDREVVWVRNGALRIRGYAEAFPDAGDAERQRVRMAVLYAWMRNRCPVAVQFVANYVATAVTALGMAGAAASGGAVAALFAAHTGTPGGAPWWLFPAATWAAVCLGSLFVVRDDVRRIVAVFRGLGTRGALRRLTQPQIAYWFVPATLCVTAVVAAAASWLTLVTALTAPTGQQMITAAAGLFGATLGLQAARWVGGVERLLHRRLRRAGRAHPLDAVLVELMAATSACSRGRARWWDPRTVRAVRTRLAVATAAAGDSSVVRRRTSVTELAARRQARRFHTALAELVRRHDRALTQMRTAGEYDAVTASLRAGVLALVTGDTEALMRHSAAEPPTSRTARLLRRTASSLVLAAFALAIPLLPGVDRATGAGVRILLLMTAALALTPADASASGSVRSALERSLFTKNTP
ncbi:hypothetical protein [Streptomyces longwoodensis]|uniref:hypothetical protein n=1 Tax=Streptomyces longwoodensis TaxID=68231 RepID=UPI0022534168|nr:hypothetical protein [Streptomyces longwoodensis]MCX5000731.1 hypothetical protein [Streptomyces longwoodensis]